MEEQWSIKWEEICNNRNRVKTNKLNYQGATSEEKRDPHLQLRKDNFKF